jgi:hypothetical protein
MTKNQKAMLAVGAVAVVAVAVSSQSPKPVQSKPSAVVAVAPTWIKNANDWEFLIKITQNNLTMAYLIAAIGMHETGWGSLGVGRDYIAGYGVYSTTSKNPKYKGFENQIKGVWFEINKFSKQKPPTAIDLAWLREFGRVEWNSRFR